MRRGAVAPGMVAPPTTICLQTPNVTLTQRSIRRRGLAAGCAVVAAVGVAACGSSRAARSDAASGPVASTASAATAPECLAAEPDPQRPARGHVGRRHADPRHRDAATRTPRSASSAPPRRRSARSACTDRAAATTPAPCGAYSQGDGASFVPSKPFTAGEQVTVKAVIGSRQGQAGQLLVRHRHPLVDRRRRGVPEPDAAARRLPDLRHGAPAAGAGPHRDRARPRPRAPATSSSPTAPGRAPTAR